jgi:putative FmdB family regulatory protein
MITYTYYCTNCDKELQIKQRITSDQLTSCPDCNSSNFKKVIKSANFALKGSGWAGKDIKSNSMARA